MLYNRWSALLSTGKLGEEWQTFEQFEADMGGSFHPSLYLTAHNPKRPHGPDNSYWSPEKPNTGGTGRPTKNRQGLRRGRLKFLHPWPAPYWLAVCDCGRMRRFSQQMTNRAVACGACAPIHGKATAWYTAFTYRDRLALKIAKATSDIFAQRTNTVVAERTLDDVPAEPPANFPGLVEGMTLDGIPSLTPDEVAAINQRQVTFK